MSDAKSLAGIVLVLGFVVLLANLLSPGNTAWDQFTAAVQALPSFVNPFAANQFDTAAVPNGEGTVDPTGFVGAPTFWEAMLTDDGNDSFVYSNATQSFFNYTLTAISAADMSMTAWTLDIACRNETDVKFAVIFSVLPPADLLMDLNTPGRVGICPASEDGQFTFLRLGGRNAEALDWSDFSGVTMRITKIHPTTDEPDSAAAMQISYVKVTLYGVTETECTAAPGAWFPWLDETACAIGRVGEVVWKGLQFAFNGLIFIAQIFVYVGSILVSIAGLFAVIFTLGAPSPFQEILDIMVVVLLLFFVVFAIQTVRGSGAGV